MWFIRVHAQNWDNFYLLLFTLPLSLIGTLVANWGNPRAHNSTKLINEVLSRSNFVYTTFFITLLTLGVCSPDGVKVVKIATVLAGLIWVISLIMTNHLLTVSIKGMHGCTPVRGNRDSCTGVPSYGQVFKLSLWNIIISIVMLGSALLLAFSQWTCGSLCTE